VELVEIVDEWMGRALWIDVSEILDQRGSVHIKRNPLLQVDLGLSCI
jgi:hypothetical protein